MIGAVAAVVALAAATSGSGLRFTDDTPDDLRAVASDAWQRFGDAVPACAGRLGGLTVGVAWELPDRARYEPDADAGARPGAGDRPEPRGDAPPRVRPPRRAPMRAERRVPAAVHGGGRPPARDPVAGQRDPWDRIPSERFAEAVMTYILGHPPSHVLVHLHPGELRAVAAWAHGG